MERHRAGDLAGALAHYEQMLEADPSDPAALHQAAIAARQLSALRKQHGKPGLDEECMRLMSLAIAGAPTNAAALHNFGKFHQDRGDLMAAQAAYLRALEIDPKQAATWVNLGNILMDLGDRQAGEECWDRACALPLSAGDPFFNRSFVKLARGEYREGWREYEQRWAAPEFLNSYGRPDLVAPFWNGGQFPGTLLLHGEQGAGDMLMMARYVPLAAARGGRVILEVYDSLVGLLRRAFPEIEVFARGDTFGGYALQLPMMSLPAVMETTLDTVPPPIPFVPWKPRPRPERHVGVVWAGSPTHPNDRARSMTVEAAAGLVAPIDGIRWRSLQIGTRELELAGLTPPAVNDFLDTAILLSKLDAVITVDTSVAHLAGSIGVPTFLLVPVHAEWRWLIDRTDSPWYPSMAIVRQPAAGDWPGVVASARAQLVAHFTLRKAA